MAINIMDRFFEARDDPITASELHKIGVTSMFIASKYEDYHPIKMKVVHERITHKKISIDEIKECELKIMVTLKYEIPVPNVLEFMKVLMQQVLNINHYGKKSLKKEEKDKFLTMKSNTMEGTKLLIYRVCLYLAKMAMHDYEIC
jgi:uncharacterized protein YggL (DUF469 family)